MVYICLFLILQLRIKEEQLHRTQKYIIEDALFQFPV